MLLIVLLGLIFLCNLLKHSKGIPKVIGDKSLFLCYFFILVLFSSRGDNVPDTTVYKNMYYGIEHNKFLQTEPLYLLINKFFLLLGFEFNSFLFFVLLFMIYLWHNSTKRILKDIPLALLLFMSFVGIFFWGVVLRAALGLTISYLAFVILQNKQNKYRYYYFYLLIAIATFFHYSIAIFAIFPLFVNRYYSSSIFYCILLFLLFIPLINLQYLLSELLNSVLNIDIFNRFSGYMSDDDYYSNVYPIRYVKNIFLAFCFVRARGFIIHNMNIYNYFLNIYIVGCILAMGLHFIGAGGSRLALNCFFFEFLLFCLIYQNSCFRKKQILSLLFAFAAVNFIDLIRTYSFFY